MMMKKYASLLFALVLALSLSVSAAADSSITYVCIQVKENSLGGFTANDAIVY